MASLIQPKCSSVSYSSSGISEPVATTEGIGLWLRQYWAEWFTVIATGSLIPLELYETLLRFGWIKLATLLANVAIVAYLVRVALQSRAARHARD